jgi:hypothetical protein
VTLGKRKVVATAQDLKPAPHWSIFQLTIA